MYQIKADVETFILLKCNPPHLEAIRFPFEIYRFGSNCFIYIGHADKYGLNENENTKSATKHVLSSASLFPARTTWPHHIHNLCPNIEYLFFIYSLSHPRMQHETNVRPELLSHIIDILDMRFRIFVITITEGQVYVFIERYDWTASNMFYCQSLNFLTNLIFSLKVRSKGSLWRIHREIDGRYRPDGHTKAAHQTHRHQ